MKTSEMSPAELGRSALPAPQFQKIGRQTELSTYVKIFPWTCLAVFIAAALPLLLLDPESALYSKNAAWTNGTTALLAVLFGLGSLWRLPAIRTATAQPHIFLGSLLLVALTVGNVWLLIDTNEPRHCGAVLLIMLSVSLIYPRVVGMLIVTVPPLAVVTWLAIQSDWQQRWLFAFFATAGGTIVSLIAFFARRMYFHRHQALLAERASMIEALRKDSVERAMAQESVLTERNLVTLGRLAGGIAHDLNNILVPILGNAAMLEESVHTSTHQRQAREVMRAASRARSLTQQLGYFAARQHEEIDTLDLTQILSELCPIVWRTFPQGIDIDLEAPQQPIYLHATRMDIQDLMTNLLLDAGNAAKPGTSVTVRVICPVSPPEKFLSRPNTNYCAVVVGDSAETMTPQQRDALFQPKEISGEADRGIGLADARNKAQVLGGFLGVDSAPDGGNQFCLFLPIQTPSLDQKSKVDPRITAAVATEVLVVDDEQAVRRVTAQLLERAGFVVRESESGEEALTEINSHLPDAIVMDLRMPGMGGRAATESIRTTNPRLPIVICTGFSGDAEGWLTDLPNCALLQKPYDTGDLVFAVNSLLHSELAAD